MAAAVTGIMQGVKEKTAELRAAAELKAAEAHRAMRDESTPDDPEKFILVPVALFQQLAALNPAAVTAAMASPEGVPATDAELPHLRKMAGLDGGAQ